MPLTRVDLAQLVHDVAEGRFPPADGGVSRAVPWRPGVEAAVALTGHAVLVVGQDVGDEQLLDLGVHGFGGAHDPRVAAALAGDGVIGVLDVLLTGRGTGGGGPLVPRPDLAGSERPRHAREWRDDVRVLGMPEPATTGLVTLSRGIAGLAEVGLQGGQERAEALLHGALAQVPAGQLVLASVTPGNARSLRFFLRHGFVPIGSVQQWRPARTGPVAGARV